MPDNPIFKVGLNFPKRETGAAFLVRGMKFHESRLFFFQVEPSGLCNATDSADVYKYGWVGVVRLDSPNKEEQPCQPLFEKVSHAP